MEYVKKNYDEHNRALMQEDLQKFLPGGDLHPFVKLVQNNPELELCFRGYGKNPRITIYKNNNMILNVYTTGKLKISFNHARYCKDCEKYQKRLMSEFEFKEKSDGYMTRKEEKQLDFNEIKKLYDEILKPISDSYFAASKQIEKVDDFFQKKKHTVREEREKIRQQQLYKAFKSIKDGYFLYDMEYQEPGEKNGNEPDMWGLHFDSDGKPDKIVCVEVKCKKDAVRREKSGIISHIKAMKDYGRCSDKLSERRKEAYLIMDQYRQLGLRGLTEADVFDCKDFDNLEYEILLIFTDDTGKIWKKMSQNDDDLKDYDYREKSIKVEGIPENILIVEL